MFIYKYLGSVQECCVNIAKNPVFRSDTFSSHILQGGIALYITGENLVYMIHYPSVWRVIKIQINKTAKLKGPQISLFIKLANIMAAKIRALQYFIFLFFVREIKKKYIYIYCHRYHEFQNKKHPSPLVQIYGLRSETK